MKKGPPANRTAACHCHRHHGKKVLIYRWFLVILRRGLRNDTPELKALRADCIKQFSVCSEECLISLMKHRKLVSAFCLTLNYLRTVFAEIPQYKANRVHEVISHLHYTSLRQCQNLFTVYNAYYFLRTVHVIYLSSKITDPKKLFPTLKFNTPWSENFRGRGLLKSVVIN